MNGRPYWRYFKRETGTDAAKVNAGFNGAFLYDGTGLP